MSDPLQTAQAIEPDPVPSDLPNSAPIKGDIERGYVRNEEIYPEDGNGAVHSSVDRAGDLRRKDQTIPNSDDQAAVAVGKKGDKGHGAGLTAGDEGE